MLKTKKEFSDSDRAAAEGGEVVPQDTESKP